jgi:hypothetical protein
MVVSVKRIGSMRALIDELRDIPKKVIPYATATALTRLAKTVQGEIVKEMPNAFDRPTPWTLNALRTQPATAKKLEARVEVKNVSVGGSIKPENFILPGVFGGPRKEKRFEKALRYQGVLRPGERLVALDETIADAYGNPPRALIESILNRFKVPPSGRRKAPGKGGKNSAPFFVVTSKRGPRLLLRREGKGGTSNVRSLFVMARRLPKYRRRLDFHGIARKVSEENFPKEFNRAVRELLPRFR